MIRVVVVDDEALTLELHRSYLSRLDGFEVVAECAGARSALTALLEDPTGKQADLVLLDMTMPDGTGMDVLRHLRAQAAEFDVIAVTSVRDADLVRQAVSLGVVQYLIKPFSFGTFRERMEQYAEYHRQAQDAAGPATQEEIDALLGALRPAMPNPLPKGLSAESLSIVTDDVRTHLAVSAREAAERLGMSRVAVRRYLEYLSDAGRVERGNRYGGQGRPETEYSWLSKQTT